VDEKKANLQRACSACAGEYEDPERTASAMEPEGGSAMQEEIAEDDE
jgi:hypothetical protein